MDAVVVGSGPNGLAAAITLARAGKKVVVFEAEGVAGGGLRSGELTLPGFTHDYCSAVHPMAAASPFFRSLPLTEHGARLIHPPVPLAHPLDSGPAVLLMRSIEQTAERLGRDGRSYRNMMHRFVEAVDSVIDQFLGPFRLPKHPLTTAAFGLTALRSASGLARGKLRDEPARAMFAGLAAHSVLLLTKSPSAGFGLMLAMLGHAVGWPVLEGGSQRLSNAMTSYLHSLGGEVVTEEKITSLANLPDSRAVLFDLPPSHVARIASADLPPSYTKKLVAFRHGPGVFKMDWALSAPIPWRLSEWADAGTLHLGGTLSEIQASEQTVWHGEHPEKPYVLLSQPSLFDATRAPAGKHTAWAYCHVPAGSSFDMTERIEAQIERFAPGFKECVLARHTMTTGQLESHNANYIGGDITGGVPDLFQTFARPVLRLNPYSTPNPRLFICSASTPPGAGVHGMCGYWAAKTALKRIR